MDHHSRLPRVQEWAGAAEGAPLPLGCVMDLLANLYNTGGRGGAGGEQDGWVNGW